MQLGILREFTYDSDEVVHREYFVVITKDPVGDIYIYVSYIYNQIKTMYVPIKMPSYGLNEVCRPFQFHKVPGCDEKEARDVKHCEHICRC